MNATGWTELFNGNMISAAFTMYDTAFVGWTVAILFFVYQVMLYIKTKNVTICWVTGLFFVALYTTSAMIGTFVRAESVQVMFIVLVFELAGILFVALWK